MVKSSRGSMSRRTRTLKGKSRVSVAQFVSTFKVGDMVTIIPKAKNIGLPHLRYANRRGRIIEKRGKSYMVEVADLSTTKKVIVSPIHLKLV